MSTKAKIAKLREMWVSRQESELDFICRSTFESPIEELLFMEMLCCDWRLGGHWPSLWDIPCVRRVKSKNTETYVLEYEYGPCEPLRVVPQLSVSCRGSIYRIDFAFFVRDRRFAVELDGHDFHEKTREQASRDKARDRALVEEGWIPLRFTGSDVYANPISVVDEVLGMRGIL